MSDEEIHDILRRDTTLKRFIELNLDLFSQMAKAGHGDINCSWKDGKILANRKKLVLEGQ